MDSRYHYSQILKDFQSKYPKLEAIAEGYEDISQTANVVANMILKLFVTGTFDDFRNRVHEKLKILQEREMIQADLIKKEFGSTLGLCCM